MSKKPQEFDMSKNNFGTKGWIFVIYSLMTFFMTTATGDSIKNIALRAQAGMFGWDYTSLISLTTVFGWLTIFLMFFFRKLLQKCSPKTVAMALGLIYAALCFVYPNINAQWQWIIVMCALTVIATALPQQVHAVIAANWFPRKKGLIIGWTTMGLPLGSGLGVAIYGALSGHVGMNGTYYIYGALMLVTVVICAIFVTDFPEQCGCFPDNDTSMTREDADRLLQEGIEMSKKSVWTPKVLLTTKEVWLIGVSCGIMLLFSGGFMSQMVPRMIAIGYADQAIMFMTIAALIGGVGSYVVGFIDSKIGPKKTCIVVHGVAIVACVLNSIPNTACVLISLVFIGTVLGGAANCLMSLTATMWGRYAFTNVHGILLPINQVVGSCGTVIVAQVAARWSYTGSNIIVGLLALVGILLILPVQEDSMHKKAAQLGEHANPEIV